MSQSHRYTFPAIRGIQSRREYYISMCPLRLVPRIFLFNEEEIQPELRAQRVLNKARIPQLVSYMIDNPEEYVFSAITASIDADVTFTAISDDERHFNLGLLHVPMSAQFVINDGQHRRAAIEAALKQNPALGNESIAIVFFVDTGLQRCQQMFADLNRYAVRPTQSLNVLYDYRDPCSQLAREISCTVPIFSGLTEMERSTISNRSTKVFTLSGIHGATQALLAGRAETHRMEEIRNAAVQFWNHVSRYIPEWSLVREGKLAPAELRRDFISAHTVALISLGTLGNALLTQCPNNWTERLSQLRNVDWHRRNAALWEGRATMGGRISNSRNSVLLISNVLKQSLGLSLSPDEQIAEDAAGSAANS